MIVLSERHLTRVLTSYLGYYHTWRTPLALEMDSPERRPVQPPANGLVINGYLLETNSVTAHLKGHPDVRQRIQEAKLGGHPMRLKAVSYDETKRGLLAIGAHRQLAAFERCTTVLPSRAQSLQQGGRSSRFTAFLMSGTIGARRRPQQLQGSAPLHRSDALDGGWNSQTRILTASEQTSL